MRRGLVGPPPLLSPPVPGSSWLHRTSAGASLLGLAVGVAVLALLPAGPVATTAAALALVVVLALHRSIGLGVRAALAQTRLLALVLVAAGAYQLVQNGWLLAVGVVARLLAGVLAATLVTATTPTSDLLDLGARAARPLRRLGVDGEQVALALALTLRSVPVVLGLAGQARDAARARGLERRPRALVVPLAVRVVAHGQRTGEALAARGLGDDSHGDGPGPAR